MPTEKPTIRYEDAAEVATVTGWKCKKCFRFWGDDEHMARWCCSTDQPCRTVGCPGRIEKHSTYCEPCEQRRRESDFAIALAKAVPWDGETPLFLWRDDRFFQDAASLADYCGDEGIHPADLRLVLSEENRGYDFGLHDFLSDELHEDQQFHDVAEVEKVVNDWIASHAPFSYSATGKVVTPESVVAALNWEPAEPPTLVPSGDAE